MTSLMKAETSAAPRPRPGTSARFVAVFAELLPQEVIDARRLTEFKRRIAIGLAVLLIVLIGWFALEKWGTSSANGDLSNAQGQTRQLQHQVTQYAPLISAQSGAAVIQESLTKLMAGDLQWKDMLTTLRASARHGVTLTGVTGTITAGGTGQAATPSGLSVLNQTGKAQVGTLTITGTALDKNAVAAYVDALAQVKGLAAPFPASVTTTSGSLTFSVSVIMTSDALGGKYAPRTSTPSGGN